MVWPFCRSNGGSSSSVTDLMAVEVNAAIAADCGRPATARMATMMASARMAVPVILTPIAQNSEFMRISQEPWRSLSGSGQLSQIFRIEILGQDLSIEQPLLPLTPRFY